MSTTSARNTAWTAARIAGCAESAASKPAGGSSRSAIELTLVELGSSLVCKRCSSQLEREFVEGLPKMPTTFMCDSTNRTVVITARASHDRRAGRKPEPFFSDLFFARAATREHSALHHFAHPFDLGARRRA